MARRHSIEIQLQLLQERLTNLEQSEAHNRTLETYLLVHNPTAPKSAEAFDALRRKLEASFDAKQTLLSVIARLHRVTQTSTEISTVQTLLEEEAHTNALVILDDYEKLPAAFDVHGSDEGTIEVRQPAYLRITNEVAETILRGIAHRVPGRGESNDAEQPAAETVKDEIVSGVADADLPSTHEQAEGSQ